MYKSVLGRGLDTLDLSLETEWKKAVRLRAEKGQQPTRRADVAYLRQFGRNGNDHSIISFLGRVKCQRPEEAEGRQKTNAHLGLVIGAKQSPQQCSQKLHV
jgi:hypothetical protein